ncbi:hypothetical protein AB1Y20_009862 [Prymnesium parvum]|uniref:PiggyBac transposable element-derived protein domain-containing protein n=1 Tax=Prymnesium parvum TaxID=97485 RepID=A0AB34K7R9_PRYPA
MGRHGMPLNRFKKLRSVLSFGPSDEPSLQEDPWAFVRPLVDTFNQHRVNYFNPGWLLTADESMFAWRGQVGVLNVAKCPHRSWVPRKPEPLGVEMKTVGDALSGVMIQMEICEGKEPMKLKEFSREWGATTACTMRLFKPWFGSGRVAAADSWFSGVKTTFALVSNGLHHVGDVRTNSSLFCKDALQAATGQESGAWAAYSALLALNNGKEIPIFAVSHRRGEATHTFISTCGTTLPGARANGNIDDYETARKAPCILNDYTLAQPCLDRHNRYRQFILALEKRLVTNSFNFRFGSSMHGVVFTDVFFAHRFFNDKDASFKQELGKLAYSLMHNDFLPTKTPQKSPPSTGRGSPCSDCEDHSLVQIKSLKGFNGWFQQRCILCNNMTTWCCAACSAGPLALVPVCAEKTYVRHGPNKGKYVKHGCLQRHRDNPALLPTGRRRKGAKRARGAATEGTESADEVMEDEESW